MALNRVLTGASRIHRLPALICPMCVGKIAAVECSGEIPTANRFEDCRRRCETCGVGASNASRPPVTYIYRDPLSNIPIESREGADEALSQSINTRNRPSKLRRFGFSTSEDAVTWVVFTYLLRSGQLVGALRRSGIIPEHVSASAAPSFLLWGSPIFGARGAELRNQLVDVCAKLGEDAGSVSEPDVVIDFGDAGLVFAEVKYRSGNDMKSSAYRGWSRYMSAPWVAWEIEETKASGCYELARNWCLLKALAGDRPSTLVNLGPANLFRGKEGRRLDRFSAALNTDERSRFVKISWPDLLGSDFGNRPSWFVQFCRGRRLV